MMVTGLGWLEPSSYLSFREVYRERKRGEKDTSLVDVFTRSKAPSRDLGMGCALHRSLPQRFPSRLALPCCWRKAVGDNFRAWIAADVMHHFDSAPVYSILHTEAGLIPGEIENKEATKIPRFIRIAKTYRSYAFV